MKTNIPIYRAKKIDSNEWVEGSLHYDRVKYTIREIHYDSKFNKIDPNTLAIHFPNMIDRNGKKIFASLSEDGIGGSIVHVITYNEITKKEYHDPEVVLYYNPDGEIKYINVSKKKCGDSILFNILANNGIRAEVIGIHKG